MSLHLALAKLDPYCLIEALSIYCSFQLCRRTDFSPLFLHLLNRSVLLFCPPALAFTECVIFFHTFAFSAFVMTFVCFDLIMVMFFSTSSHKKTKSALEKLSPLRLLFYCLAMKSRGHIHLPLSVRPFIVSLSVRPSEYGYMVCPPTVLELQL